MVAAREGEFAGRADPLEVRPVEVVGPVAALDDETGLGRELLGGHRDIVYSVRVRRQLRLPEGPLEPL